MPLCNRQKNDVPRSKKLEELTYKNGLRHAIFSTNGYRYIGEWKNNEKNGRYTVRKTRNFILINI